ncbi:hypothetical protein BDR06DRAFT_980506 [Suillus hirtellus]|nr:hypothetical protein BDR06DRAFT_980506 [Suillus hirtellus]
MLCNYPSLLTNGTLRLEQMEETPLEDFSADEQQEHHIGKGAAGTRGDDTKTLKNSKIDRGFNHELTGSLLCPARMDWTDPETKENLRSSKMLGCGDQWPIFLYTQYTYDPDDLWCGLLRSQLLVCAYKHVFMSPSSVKKEPKAIRSGNAHLHSMNCVTIASISYIATQVRQVSSLVFSRTDTTTDSETFYHSLLDLLEDPEECKEVDQLLMWWNQQVFPTSSAAKQLVSALLKIRQKHLTVNRTSNLNAVSS